MFMQLMILEVEFIKEIHHSFIYFNGYINNHTVYTKSICRK